MESEILGGGNYLKRSKKECFTFLSVPVAAHGGKAGSTCMYLVIVTRTNQTLEQGRLELQRSTPWSVAETGNPNAVFCLDL